MERRFINLNLPFLMSSYDSKGDFSVKLGTKFVNRHSMFFLFQEYISICPNSLQLPMSISYDGYMVNNNNNAGIISCDGWGLLLGLPAATARGQQGLHLHVLKVDGVLRLRRRA